MTEQGRVPPLPLLVDCYAGWRGEETPRRFAVGDQWRSVTEVIDRWLAPDRRYFKVLGDDGHVYVLRHDSVDDCWELVSFTTGAGTPGGRPG
jgi:hypothetical protein